MGEALTNEQTIIGLAMAAAQSLRKEDRFNSALAIEALLHLLNDKNIEIARLNTLQSSRESAYKVVSDDYMALQNIIERARNMAFIKEDKPIDQ